MTESKTQVVIVGGGPVGLGLAIDLGQRGIRSLVIEQEQDPTPIPKGQNLTQRTMEHFRAWGVEKEIRSARVLPDDYPIAGLTAYGNLLSGYTHPWHRRHLVREYYLVDNERLPQYETERVLRERATKLENVDLRTGWRAIGIIQDQQGVQVNIESIETGEITQVRADFCAGCDGSHSLVREQAGIELAVQDHDRRMALLLFRSPDLHERLERFPDYSFYNVITPELDGYWRFLGRVDVGEGFFYHAPVPMDATEENYDFNKLLNDTVGAQIAADIYYVGFWDLRFAMARQYRKDRVFVAGDAAHSHPPYGGYGINTGLEDARNLAWKLAAHYDGWAGAGLLDSYSAERQPVFASTAEDFIVNYIDADRDFMRRFNPEKDREEFAHAWSGRTLDAETDIHAFAPNYEGSPIVCGPPGSVSSALGDHSHQARPGHHLSPQPLSGADDIFASLGSGYTLLALDAANDAVERIKKSAADQGVPLKVVCDDLAQGRDNYDAKYVLIRPDEYVAWSGDSPPDDPEVLFERLAGS